MRPYKHIFKVTLSLLLCLQLFNVCIYVPAWMHPGNVKTDLTESVLELIVEGFTHDSHMMYAEDDDNSNSPSLTEETLEDLHLSEMTDLDFALFASSQVQHNYYHFTLDIKTHVFSVVSPPPDFC